MPARRVAATTAFVVGSTFLIAWLFDWPLVRAGLLAPVVVAVGGILGFWGLVAVRSLRDASRPRQVVTLAIAVLVVLLAAQLLLAHLGVKLPSELG